MTDTRYTISLVDRVSNVANRINSSLGRVQQKAQRVAQAIDSIGLIAGGAAVAGIFKFGAELESTRLVFDTLTGSVEAGKKVFEGLTEFANTTPFQNNRLNANAKTLMAFGESGNTVVDTLRMLGDVAAGDQNRLDSLTLAFAQSQSAGKLMGQDLLQFINAGFNPLQIIAEKTGKSVGYWKDQMSKGAVSAEMVKWAFKAATAEGGRFHGLTEKMSRTMAGKWSTVMGKAKFLMSEFGLSMKDIFLPFLDGILKAIEFVNKYKKVFFPLLTMITIGISVVTALGIAFKILNAIMWANPITLVIGAIAALISIIIYAVKRSEKFRSVILGTWEVLRELYNMTLGKLIPVFRALGNVLSETFSTIKIDKFMDKFKTRFVDEFKRFLSQIEGVLEALDLLLGGDLKGAQAAFMKGMEGGYTGIVDAYNRGAEKAKKTMEEGGGLLGGGGLNGLSLGLSPEAQKLQAQGIVSGGIKTFNININQLTGVGTLSATSIEESSSQIGDSVIRALTEALADIKNID